MNETRLAGQVGVGPRPAPAALGSVDVGTGASRRLVLLAEISVAAFVLASVLVKPLGYLMWPGPVSPVPVGVSMLVMATLLLVIVMPAVRGRAPVAPRTMLAAMVAVAVAGTLGSGPEWSTTFGSVGLAVLLVVRPPWSWVAFVAVVLSAVPLTWMFAAPAVSDRITVPVEIARALAPYTMIRLIGLVRQLDAARAALAVKAVEQERLRVDDELRRTVGAELADIAAAAGSVAAHVHDAGVVEPRLRALVTQSRRTLAEVRRMVRGFQRASLRTELDTAVTLLRAAGIDATAVAPRDALPDDVEEQLRAWLRAATTQLLRAGDVRSCVLRVSREDGRVVLDVTADGASRLSGEVRRA